MFASVVTVKEGGWFASLQGKFTGTRYYTYTNDQGFGGFTTFDLGAGYNFGELSLLRNARLAVNVTNLTDKRYVANLDNSVFAPVDPQGRIVVAHSAAPRQVFATLSVAF
jgi:iron complex outermembrane receptor protein